MDSEINTSLPVKIAGAATSGTETTFVNSSPNGDIQSQDLLRNGGVYGSFTVGTTAVEIRVGGSRLPNRKLVTLDNTSNVTLFWGYNSSITTTAYAGRIFRDQQISWAASDAVSIFVIAGTAGNTTRISEGA